MRQFDLGGTETMGILSNISHVLQDMEGSGVHARIIVPENLETSPDALKITVLIKSHAGNHTISHLTLTAVKHEIVAPDMSGASWSLLDNSAAAPVTHEAQSSLDESFPVADQEERRVDFTIPYAEFFDFDLKPPLVPAVNISSDPQFLKTFPGRHELSYELDLGATVDEIDNALHATNRFTVFAFANNSDH